MAVNEALVEAVRRAAIEREGRMTLRCEDAFAVAREHDVRVLEIGRICNQNKIKIVQCQLGCFQ
jgi:hypothetical protein